MAELDRAPAADVFMRSGATGPSHSSKDEDIQLPAHTRHQIRSSPADVADIGDQILELFDSHEMKVFIAEHRPGRRRR